MIDTTINSYEIKVPKIINLPPNNIEGIYNQVALTPPMGWTSSSSLGTNITESNIAQTVSSLSKCGLIALGYNYLNLGDGWQSPNRDSKGNITINPSKFPNGISSLVNNININGMKLGLYSSNGTTTCLGNPGSLNNESVDAANFASWGIEYLKYDFCNNPITSTAPNIDKIAIFFSDTSNFLYPDIEAENGKLIKNATIVKDSTSSNGAYVTGLSANNGYLLFSNITITTSGNYDLWIYFNSIGYIEVCVNYGDIYPINISSSNASPLKLSIYLKKGFNTIMLYNDIVLPKDSAQKQFMKMGKALKKATLQQSINTGTLEKQIVFSISDLGINKPWEWAKFYSNSWTTTPALSDDWNKIIYNYTTNMKYALYATPGSWNDCDTLQVGSSTLTYDENKSHFTLWCMMWSPLIIGMDVRSFINNDGSVNTQNQYLQILSNKDMIAINQDKKGLQCRFYQNNSDIDILLKPLDNNNLAICILNKTSSSQNVQISILDILNKDYVTLPHLNIYKTFDLWDKTISSTSDLITVSVPTHGVKAFKITPTDIGQLPFNQTLTLNNPAVIGTNNSLIVNATLINTGSQPIKNINMSLNTPNTFLTTPIATQAVVLKVGESYSAGWTTTVPSTEWDYILNATATFNYDSQTTLQSITTSNHIRTLSIPTYNNLLSNTNWLTTFTTLGSIKRNKLVSGKPMSINGVSYTSGICVTANNDIKIFNGKNPVNFYSLIGIDDCSTSTDPKTGFPIAIFQVWGDNQKIYDSGILKYTEIKEIYLDLSFYDIITLRVLDPSHLFAFAHYNWINLTFTPNNGC